MSEVHEGTPVDTSRSEGARGLELELGFEIRFQTGDGEKMAIPCADLNEVERMLGRLRGVCERGGVEPPALTVWRLDRRAPRALSEAELEEAGSVALSRAKGRRLRGRSART